MMTIKFKRMRPTARMPEYGHGDPSNAGLDLFLAESREIGPNQDAWISTGVAWDPTGGLSSDRCGAWKPALLVRGRSSAAKRGLLVTEGTVDAGYRGEIMVHVRNPGPFRIELWEGDRVAQAVPILIPHVFVEEVGELSDSDRGSRGFGSSGI